MGRSIHDGMRAVLRVAPFGWGSAMCALLARPGILVLLACVSLAALLPACVAEDCEKRMCADIVAGTSLRSNGRVYTHCQSCDGSGHCHTSLEDVDGKSFFDCTDGASATCTGATVDAEFGYCGIQ
jgi:hypothetical protein